MSEPLELVRDPETLHDRVADDAMARGRVDDLRRDVRTAPDDIAELIARGELVDLLRVLGDLDDALNEARAAADRAEIAGTAAQQHIARVRLAHVHQWRGDFAEANLLVTELLAAAQQFGPIVEAFTHEHAGLNDYDQGHWSDAVMHFERALTIRAELELDDEAGAARNELAAARRRAGSEEGT